MSAKFTSRVSWREKLERQQEPKIVDIPVRMQARFGKGRMVIPKPLDVDALIRRVPFDAAEVAIAKLQQSVAG